ncbi:MULTISPECIES: oligosaccharide flippase family protein [unclassified Empedobacter]|uniref:oligosaccharide flippase family protein n=1 Tax=unclassified Empedobacter TaxID=2643773 RepID=UPI0025B87BEB|nr:MULTISPECIES: oligosaccharide flippase family protein [unclassified Empedobacter]
MNLNIIFKKFLSNDVNQSIIKNSFWLLIGTLFSKLFLLGATIVTARILGKIEYGEFGIIKSTINMFITFAELGLGLTATKFISEYKKTEPVKVGKIIILSNIFSILFGLCFSVLIILFSSDLAKQINASHLSGNIEFAALILFFSVLNGAQNGILVGLESFKNLAINNIIAGIISFVLQILGSYKFGLNGLIFGFSMNFFILFILNFLSIYKITKSTYNIRFFSIDNFSEISVLWKFSLPAVLSGVAVNPVVWICNNFLVNQSKGYNEMANFDIGNQWRLTILFIPTVLAQIALPMLSKSANNKTNFKYIFYQNLKLNIIVSSLFTLLIICLSPFILKLYGEKYDDALIPFIIMILTTGIIAVNNVIGQALASKSKMWIAFFFNVIWGLMLIFLSYYFIVLLNYKAIGLALAYIISYLIHTVIQFLFYKRIINE